MLKYLCIPLLLISTQSFATSKCEELWNNLKNIQSQLRHKSTEYLRQKEHESHTKYQNCRKNKNISNNKKGHSNNQVTKKHYSNLISTKNVDNDLVGDRSVNVKGYFKGEKQNAWLKYYKKPDYCKRNSSSQLFAKCTENRVEQADEFDQKWNNENAPASIKLATN